MANRISHDQNFKNLILAEVCERVIFQASNFVTIYIECSFSVNESFYHP